MSRAGRGKVVWGKRKVERRQDVWVWEGCVCAREEMGQLLILLMAQKTKALATSRRTSLLTGIKGSAPVSERVLVRLRMLISGSCKEGDDRTMGLQEQNENRARSYEGQKY